MSRHIDVQRLAQSLRGDVLDVGGRPGNAGIVDENIDAAHLLVDRREEISHRIRAGYVGLAHQRTGDALGRAVAGHRG